MRLQWIRHFERERVCSRRRLYQPERRNLLLRSYIPRDFYFRSAGLFHNEGQCSRAGFGMAFLLMLLMTTFAVAQSPRRVTVELKNGNFLRGEMAGTVQKDYLTLIQDGQPLIQISYRKIRSIHFGVNPPRDSSLPRVYLQQNRQFFHLGEFSVLVGDGSYYPNTTVGIHTVNGYHFNPRLGVGLGVGMDRYSIVSTLPIYASVRGVLLKRKVSPYYFANVGAGPAWGSDHNEFTTDFRARGGIMMQLGLGYQVNLRRSALLFHVGVKSQRVDLSYQQNWWGTDSFVEEKRNIRRVSVGVGFML